MKNHLLIKLLAVSAAACMILSFAGCSTQPSGTEAGADATTPAVSQETSPSASVPSDPERITPEEGQLLFSFEDGISTVSFYDLSTYGFTPPAAESVMGDRVQSGSALQLVIDCEKAHGTISCQINAENGNINSGMAAVADYSYLRFWINNIGDSDVSVAVVLVTPELKNGCLNPDGALLTDQFGKPEDSFPTDAAFINATNGTGYTHVSIPAGFAGWVYYPLDGQLPWWEGTTLTDADMLNVNQISLDIRFDDATSADYIVFDEFCLADPQ